VEEKMKIDLDLIESVPDISKMILDQIKKKLDSSLSNAIPKLSLEISNLIETGLRNQPEYSSLLAGSLKAELGLPNTQIVEDIIQDIKNSIAITKQTLTIKNGITGGLLISILSIDDINRILSSGSSSVTTEKGVTLKWLDWLLTSGNSNIVLGYSVQYGNYPRSRSNMAIMVKSDSSWSVPSDYAGDISDNWITRAINSVNNNIVKTIEKTIKAYIV
jgi:hypothetical protein